MAATTWDVPVEFEYATTRTRRIERTQPVDGFVARRSVWPQSAPLREFRLTWKNATDATVARLRQMWTQAKGGADTITYTPVDDVTAVPVRFSADGLTITRKGAMIHQASCTLVEERL